MYCPLPGQVVKNYFKIELLDIKSGTSRILVDKYDKRWYKYENFSFSTDESAVAFTFKDMYHLPGVTSIYWMTVDI